MTSQSASISTSTRLWIILAAALLVIVAPGLAFSLAANADEAATAEEVAAEEAAAEEEADEEAASAARSAAPAEEPVEEVESAPAEEEVVEEEAPAEDEVQEEAPAEEKAESSSDETSSEDEAAEAVGLDEAALEEAALEESVALLTVVDGDCPFTGGTGDGLAGGFEIDGNCGVDGDGLDWDSPEAGTQPVFEDGLSDCTQYTQGSQEDNWDDWTGTGCGTATNQSEIDEVYAWANTVDGNLWGYVGFTRPTDPGTIGYAVELNQLVNKAPGVPDRLDGDLRFLFGQDGNGALQLVRVDEWDGGAWSEIPLGDLSDDFYSGVSDDKLFLEAALDITDLVGLAPGCPPTSDFGQFNLRSGASNGQGALKDYAAFEIVVPDTCTTMQVTKNVEGVADGYAWGPFEFELEGPDGTEGFSLDSGSPSITFDEIEPGEEYTLTETPVDGYTAGDLECTFNGEPLGTTDGPSVTFTAPEGDGDNTTIEIDCEITNTAIPSEVDVTKTVAGVADSFDWEFEFTISPEATPAGAQTASGTGDGSATVGWSDLVPGEEYTITEATVDGYTAGDLECEFDGESFGETDGASVTFTAPLGGEGVEITCEITNTAIPSEVDVTKTVAGVADSFEWDFEFTISPDATPAGAQTASGTGDGSATVTWTDLVPGQEYTIAETAVEGFEAGTLVCEDAEGSVDTDGVDDASVTFIAPLGGEGVEINCEITNTPISSEVEVTKTVAGVADSFEWDFEFTISPEATPAGSQTASGTGDGSATVGWTDLVPGEEYTITEATVEGYTAGDLECEFDGEPFGETDGASVTFIAPLGGEGVEITCEITNTAIPSEVEVTKTVAGVADSFEWDFEFTISPDATPAGSQTASGTGDGSATVTWTDLVPGEAYTITEVEQPGYDAQVLECNVPDTDGAADASVTFIAPLGGEGVEVTCSLVNEAQAGQLSIVKIVSGVADGFAWGPFTFTLTPDDGSAPVEVVVDSDNPEATFTDLVPGVEYTLEEVDVPDGYDLDGISCSVTHADDSFESIDLPYVIQPGDVVVCDVTNVARPSQVTVTKEVLGIADTLDWEFEFTIVPETDGEEATQTASGTGEGTAVVGWDELVPGETYTITETSVDGYDAGELTCEFDGESFGESDGTSVTFEAPLDIDAEGPEIVCGIINTAIPAEVDVTKTVEGVADDWMWSFDFTISPTPDGQEATQAAAGTGNSDVTVGWTDLVPGESYTISETAQAGFETPTLVCVGVEDTDGTDDASVTFVAPLGGEGVEVTCSITNTARPSQVEVTKTVVGIADDWDWSFDFTIDPATDDEDATQTASGTGDGDATVGWDNLVPGETYIIAETTIDGFTASEFVCEGLDDLDEDPTTVTFVAPLDVDEQAPEVTCSITNTAAPGMLEIVKSTVGGDGSFTFALTPEGGDPVNLDVTTSGGTGSVVVSDIVPGTTWTLSEVEPGGRWVAGDLTCTVTHVDESTEDVDPAMAFTVLPGDAISCAITNTLPPLPIPPRPIPPRPIPPQPTPILPHTGVDLPWLVAAASVLLLAGAALVGVGRRDRRREVS